MNKAVLSNFVALVLTLLALILEAPFQNYLLNIGLFALSGGITNWLAVYMLFERVPGVYGSGVIPLRFEEFKIGIRNLVMDQFFNQANLQKFFDEMTDSGDKLEQQLKDSAEKLDLESAFEALVEVIMASSFGSMLGMFGGRDAMNPLKGPFVEKMRDYMAEVFNKEDFKAQLRTSLSDTLSGDAIRERLETLVEARLNEMTPQIVKEIIQKMIKEHLGWLVVWGCVFGGLVGLIVAFVTLHSS